MDGDLGDTSEPVDGQAYGYDYDNIGNRKVSNRGSKAMTYTANGLTQYTQRTVPDGIDVLGSAETNTTVTVNNLATTRFAKYWFRALTVTNTSVPVYQAINIVGVYNPSGTNDPDVVTTAAGHAFVAKTPEAFTYDDDGNLLSDGRFNYSWDAENRLIAAETSSNLVGTAVPAVRLEFAYDYISRRTAKTVYSGLTNSAYSTTNVTTFLYDGWNMIFEVGRTVPGEPSTNSYVWGLDLSGSLSGAGGIGGLLAATIGTNSVVYTADANGNVSELVDTQSGSLAAHYEYSAFGETIVATGPLAKENKFRFSSKYTDDEIAMLYYGYRYYSPSLGRWLSRDPIAELGGNNQYEAMHNDALGRIDSLGLCVTIITLGDSLTYGPGGGTGYAQYLSVKEACSDRISFGGAGQRTGKIRDGYKNPTASCDEKVALVAMMGMNDALGLANDLRFDEKTRQKNYDDRLRSTLAEWKKLYDSVKNDFTAINDPKPKVVFVTVTIPGIARTPNLNPSYVSIIGQINGFISSLNAQMPTTCSPDGDWWSCATANASGVSHTIGVDKDGRPYPKASDDGIHFLADKNRGIVNIISGVVNGWSGE